jgi:hypothetical protein
MSEPDARIVVFKSKAEAWVAERGQDVWRAEREAYRLLDDSRPLHASWEGSEGDQLDLTICDGSRSCGLHVGGDWRYGWNEHATSDIAGAIADDVRHANFGDPCVACAAKAVVDQEAGR